jgi:hypothetical protein
MSMNFARISFGCGNLTTVARDKAVAGPPQRVQNPAQASMHLRAKALITQRLAVIIP